VKESQDFKREVMETGIPGKREITFETELFGSKTFLLYAEPVFSKAGETIGVNHMGMEITDQVKTVTLIFAVTCIVLKFGLGLTHPYKTNL
jgi:hypothetical protein